MPDPGMPEPVDAEVRSPVYQGIDYPHMTDREAGVLRLLAWRRSDEEIAYWLEISVTAVEVHRANALRKLALRDRVDVIHSTVGRHR